MFYFMKWFNRTRGFRGQCGKISEKEEKGSILLETTMRKKGRKFLEEGKLEDKLEIIKRNFRFFKDRSHYFFFCHLFMKTTKKPECVSPI